MVVHAVISIKSPTKPEPGLSFCAAESCDTPVSVALLLEEISMRLGVKIGLGFEIHSSTAEEKPSVAKAKLALQSEPCTAPLGYKFSFIVIRIFGRAT